MNLEIVPQAEETTTEAEKPDADLLPLALATMLPVGMIEGLKAIRHEIALLHAQVIKDYGMIPSYLGGAYTAINDAENFLKQVANGKEEFTPVPKKPEVRTADKVADDNTIKVPSNLKDIPYMQEWAGQFFFPALRGMVERKDVEVDIQANHFNKKTLSLSISVTTKDAAPVILPGKYKANDVIDLAALAKSIDAL